MVHFRVVSDIGRYRVMRRLGSGGMAEVLEAEALGAAGFVRRVAIKRMLGAANEDPSFARMFLDEARIASRLHHANIVSVVDYGLVDGVPFQVLELVDGVDARTLVRRAEDKKLPVDIALYIVAQIGHALAAAHDAVDAAGEHLGIVHRDVSPGNVLVSWDGDVKLADFGIAFAKDKSEKTEAGTTKGTLIYMSPEQAITGRVDRRADIFSLGCVLHTLITGASPLAGDHFSQFLSTQTVPLAGGMPEDVHSIVEIATQYDPEQRFQSAIAMTEAVGRALAPRVDREPRRRLVEYLAPLRKKAPDARGKLDDLLRVEIVVAGGDTATREFRTASGDAVTTTDGMESTTRDLRPEPTARLSPLLTHAPLPEAEAPQARRSRAPWVAGVFGLAAFGALALGATWWARGGRAPTAPAAPSTLAASVSAASISPPPASVDAEPTAPPAATSAASSTPRPSVAHGGRRTSASGRSIEAAPAVASSAAAARCTGAVFLSCPLAPRASISIDGAQTGYHHGDFVDLGCTAHAVAFDAGEGRRSSRTASPTSANTRTSPLEIRCGL